MTDLMHKPLDQWTDADRARCLREFGAVPLSDADKAVVIAAHGVYLSRRTISADSC